MRLAELFSMMNTLSSSVVVKARYKKEHQGRYGSGDQWGIIDGDSLILIDQKGEKHGVMSLDKFVKSSIKELALADLQELHQRKSA